jgi:hypothetical protein
MSEEIDPQPIMSEERTLKSYTQLLTDYSSFERELEELENLQYRWETTLASEKYSDNELYVKIRSTVEAIQGKLQESVPLCDYIDNSPYKEQCYRLFKENFDNMKGFKLPETGQEFLDYIIDYSLRISEIIMRHGEMLLNNDLPALMGCDVDLEEEFEVTMDMLKDNNGELDEIYARWKNCVGTIRFTINGNVSNPVHSSKEVGEYMWALITGYKGYMGRRHGEIFSALEQGKVVMCRLNNKS